MDPSKVKLKTARVTSTSIFLLTISTVKNITETKIKHFRTHNQDQKHPFNISLIPTAKSINSLHITVNKNQTRATSLQKHEDSLSVLKDKVMKFTNSSRKL